MSSKQQRTDKWRNLERHHCSVCNAWMGGDKQSILIHENGKRHKTNMEKHLQTKRLNKLKEEEDKQKLDAQMREMNKIAMMRSRERDAEFFGVSGQPQQPMPMQQPMGFCQMVEPPPNVQEQEEQQSLSKKEEMKLKSNEMDSWKARNQRREDEKQSGSVDDSIREGTTILSTEQPKRVVLGEFEGHYKIGDAIYLEGATYAPIFEEDMPAQIWTGTSHKKHDMRDESNQHLWKTGLVIKIHKIVPTTKDECHRDVQYLFNFAFLQNPDDDDETLKIKIDPSRLRLEIGEEGAPSTLEEARLTLMGGEEVVHISADKQQQQQQRKNVDENTGFTTWSTVSVRKTTQYKQDMEERARRREQQRDEAERKKMEQMKEEERKMEEAKYANADDSALGAYDVWCDGKKGYKGVDIQKEAEKKVDGVEMVKKLSEGKVNVSFKKRGVGDKDGGGSFQKAKKKQFRRKTFADDD